MFGVEIDRQHQRSHTSAVLGVQLHLEPVLGPHQIDHVQVDGDMDQTPVWVISHAI